MTNKLVLRDVDKLMEDYVPVYKSIFGLFLGNAEKHAAEVGQLTFKRLEAVSDIRAKHITPKDTEIRQVVAVEKSKVFKKYFLANQFIQSSLQDRSQNEDVVKQVLDENNKLNDDLLMLGEGTSNSTMVNNGLFWSGDSNYVLESSEEIAKASDGTHIQDLHAEVVVDYLNANTVAGRKMIMFYGSSMLQKINGLYLSSGVSFKSGLRESVDADIVEIPADITPSNTNGYIIVNLDQVKLNYTVLPSLLDQGVNGEKMHSWHNFLVGSCMLEVKAYKGIIRQPCTFAA